MKLGRAPSAGPGAPIAAEHIDAARLRATATATSLLDALEDCANAPGSDEFVTALAATVHLDALSMEELRRLAPDFTGLPFTQAQRRLCIPLRTSRGELRVAIADPFDSDLRAWLEARLDESFELCIAHRDDIRAALARHEASMRATDSELASAGTAAHDAADSSAPSLTLASISSDTSPVVRLVSSTLYDALKLQASDVHVESTAAGLTIKFRIDGALVTVGTIAGREIAEQALSRLKVLAELDIAERRVPQDGRFRVTMQGRPIDLRVSVMPSIHGEDAVLRILDRRALADVREALTLDHLGFEAATMERMRVLARAPYGMLLVTGPTGSGKTTTLYALLSEINTGQDKIITIEDPVEYQLAGVLQIPVNEKKGLSFSRGLRSILRHDPDRILVGEIRDPETAEIAVQAALTGHQVYTTVHANSAFDVIGRFTHMGIEPYTLASALNGIVAQRLIRLVCSHCAIRCTPDAGQLAASGLSPESVRGFDMRIGRGCGHCRGTGYRGRRAIAEVLAIDDDLRDGIVSRASPRQLRAAASRQGTTLLRQAALDAVARGLTTLQEVNRVTHAG